jgi:hypothetical protein
MFLMLANETMNQNNCAMDEELTCIVLFFNTFALFSVFFIENMQEWHLGM